ncbi:hypothetical protein F5Y14DRAFT_449089 [Nemania sp. NC0429]|nr:hypothetical protein F5Y14DRAFT_449089 [Nemania sp. NC0429]
MGDQWGFNLFQQIYCFSMMTGIVSGHKGSEQELQDAMITIFNDKVPGLTGNWTISWGPRVFKEKKDPKYGPDNVWFAAIDEKQKICVVAIAGTQADSGPDIYQDIDVVEVVDFNAWVGQWSQHGGITEPQTADPTENKLLPYCAKGVCAGVWNVLRNTSTAAGEGMRIDEYLRSLDSSYTVVFTGHSLGGALAPISAKGLTQANLIGDRTVKVLASAGVSPGNEIFAANYTSSFPQDPPSGEGYQVYNLDFYNTLDVVPQAWSINLLDDRNLENILTKIIHPSEDFSLAAKILFVLAFGQSLMSKIRYTPLPGRSFTGPPPPDVVNSVSEVLDYLSNGHVYYYWKETGIYEFMTKFYDGISEQLGRPPKFDGEGSR